MELLLPIVLRFAPGMLPSTFRGKNDKENTLRKEHEHKLRMSKFLRDSLREMGESGKDNTNASAKEFANFFKKVSLYC